jgi:HK97 family phage portal protein
LALANLLTRLGAGRASAPASPSGQGKLRPPATPPASQPSTKAQTESRAGIGSLPSALPLPGNLSESSRFLSEAGLVQRGFHRNVVVHRCVRMIAETCAAVPVHLYQRGARLEAHPLLALWRRPNPTQSSIEWLEGVYAFLLLNGNSYVEIAGDDQPTALYTLRPDRVRVHLSHHGWPQFYDYTVNGRTRRYDQTRNPAPIIHLRYFHPQDDHYGFSPLQAAALAIDIHNAANSWNKSLFENAARPSGALVYRGQDGASHLTDEQFQRLKEELETNFQGSRNAGRPLLLEGGLDWSSISLSPQDMDFIDAKHSAARDIALAFGVPPMLLGIPGDNTYANYAEAQRAFWRQTILPLAERVITALAHHLCREEDLTLRPALDEVPALAEERRVLWQRLERAGFLSQEEKRHAVGYPAQMPDAADWPQPVGKNADA